MDISLISALKLMAECILISIGFSGYVKEKKAVAECFLRRAKKHMNSIPGSFAT